MAKVRPSLAKQAIADAKQLREVAIAAARSKLEEHFQPQLTHMLATKLKNEIEYTGDAVTVGGDTLEGDAQEDKYPLGEELDTSAIGDGENKEPSSSASDSSSVANDKTLTKIKVGGDTLETDVKGDEKYPLGEGFGDEEELGGEEDEDELGGLNLEGEEDIDLGGEEGEGEEGDSLDLDNIIKELEADANAEDEDGDLDLSMNGGEEEEELGEGDEELDLNIEPDGDEGEEELGEGEEELDLTDITPNEEGEEELGEEGEMPNLTANDELGDEEEVDLAEILREMEDEEELEKKGAEDAQEFKFENRKLKTELREHREALKYLRTKLHEVNLLNAKLLFTNKLFKSFPLTTEQKVRVVETFDRAISLREVKLVYSTLAESLGNRSSSAGKNASRRVVEGLASKPTRSSRSTEQTKGPAIIQENVMVDRFKFLAGITKNNN